MVLSFTRGGGAAGEEEEEEEVVDDDDDDEEEENATVRTDVLLLPRQEGDVLEDVDADVVVDAYEVDALLAAQTNARLLVHARILCCVVMHGRLSSFVSVVGLMKNLYFFTNRKRRNKSASSHSCRNKNLAKQKEREKKHTHTQTCFLFPHPPSLELPFRLRSKVRAMRSSQKALESAFPSAAIFIFCFSRVK